MEYKRYPLADFTSFGVGGPANIFVAESSSAFYEALKGMDSNQKPYVLGYGTNCLISDKGLSSPVISTRGGTIRIDSEKSTLTADAGVWWDTVVLQSVERKLWGLELMSGIPGSVGGGVVGNIAAYGQRIADSFINAEVFDTAKGIVRTLRPEDMGFAYRQTDLPSSLIILNATFQLSPIKTVDLAYDSALKVAGDLHATLDSPQNSRAVILESRRRAGALYDSTVTDNAKTTGSFFKNPLVSPDQLAFLASFEEQKERGLQQVLRQNKVHGENQSRVSAAHVMLAAGFKRGQSWGPVRLHPDHVLKIENTGGATAQQIYDVSRLIQEEVKAKLAIDLEPEVKILGSFNK